MSSQRDALEAQFAALDTDGSGCISPDELLAQMPAAELEQAKAVLAMIDANDDGRISLEEFIAAYGDEDEEGDEDSETEAGDAKRLR